MREGREVEVAGGPEHSIFGNEIDQFIKLRIFSVMDIFLSFYFPALPTPLRINHDDFIVRSIEL